MFGDGALQHTNTVYCSFGCVEWVPSFEGSLEVKLPTVWKDEKAKVGRAHEEKGRRNQNRDETGRRSKIQVREKVEKSRNTVFFHGFVGGTTTWQGGCGRESVAVVGRWSVDHGIPITLSIEYGLQFYNQ